MAPPSTRSQRAQRAHRALMDLAPLDPRQAFRISEDELPPSEAEDSEAPTLADGADENNPPAQRV